MSEAVPGELSQTLPEAKRLAYLEAMGVTSYFPAIMLPGAPASRLCETAFRESGPDDAPLPADSGLASQAKAETPIQAPKSGGDILRDLVPQAERSPRPEKPATSTSPQPSAQTEKIAFNLRFIQSPGQALIVDSSPTATPEAALQRFAANLLAVLGKRAAEEEHRQLEVQSHLFRWPVAGNVQIDQGEEAAREAVQAAVAATCERCEIKRVLVMGDAAARFSGELAGLQVQTMPAIAHYLMEPLAKRELWQALRSG